VTAGAATAAGGTASASREATSDEPTTADAMEETRRMTTPPGLRPRRWFKAHGDGPQS
jgi:hypothetical protein